MDINERAMLRSQIDADVSKIEYFDRLTDNIEKLEANLEASVGCGFRVQAVDSCDRIAVFQSLPVAAHKRLGEVIRNAVKSEIENLKKKRARL